MNIRNSPYDRRRLTTWLLLLGVIPLPSIYGRRLQAFSWEHLNTDALARCIAAPILMLMRFLALAITLFGFNTLLQAQELRLIVLDVNEGQAVLLQQGDVATLTRRHNFI